MAIGRPLNLTPNVATKNISVIATSGQTQFTVTGGYRINEIAVYQNGVYSYEGNRRKFMFYNLNKFWDAYDTTKIIRTEQMSKQDIKMLQDEQVEEKIYDDIYKHLKTQPEKKLSLMEVKKLTGIDWKLSEIEKYLKFIGKSTRVKGIYDFEHIY